MKRNRKQVLIGSFYQDWKRLKKEKQKKNLSSIYDFKIFTRYLNVLRNFIQRIERQEHNRTGSY